MTEGDQWQHIPDLKLMKEIMPAMLRALNSKNLIVPIDKTRAMSAARDGERTPFADAVLRALGETPLSHEEKRETPRKRD